MLSVGVNDPPDFVFDSSSVSDALNVTVGVGVIRSVLDWLRVFGGFLESVVVTVPLMESDIVS